MRGDANTEGLTAILVNWSGDNPEPGNFRLRVRYLCRGCGLRWTWTASGSGTGSHDSSPLQLDSAPNPLHDAGVNSNSASAT